MINLNLSIFSVELSFVLLFCGFEGFLVALHKAAVQGFFISIRCRLELDDDYAIALIFNGLNGQLGVPMFNLHLVEGLDKGFPIDPVAKDQVDGVEHFLKEFGKLAGAKAAAAGATFLLVAQQVHVVAMHSF